MPLAWQDPKRPFLSSAIPGPLLPLLPAGDLQPALDQAVRSLATSGVSVVVAAGNSDINACTISPAREPSVVSEHTGAAGVRRACWWRLAAGRRAGMGGAGGALHSAGSSGVAGCSRCWCRHSPHPTTACPLSPPPHRTCPAAQPARGALFSNLPRPTPGPKQVTVGATDSNDDRLWISAGVGSNTGPCIDLFAPGKNIVSASNVADNAQE